MTRLPPMCLRLDSWTRRHMWVEFVVGSRLSSEGFSPGSAVFLPPQKINISKFQFDREFEGHGFVSRRCATLVKQSQFILSWIIIHDFIYLFIYLFNYLLFEPE